MAAAIGVRDDYDAGAVGAKRSKFGPQARRLLALAAIYDGATRTEAAKIGGVAGGSRLGAQIQCAGADSLIDRKAPGPPRRG